MISRAPRTHDVERFARLEALIDAALERPAESRATFIEAHCDDVDMHREATALLQAIDDSEGFLEAPPETGDERSERRAGPWRLVRRLGRGGMGEVWLAERADERFEQVVAIKMLHRRDQNIERFVQEQRLLARLSHPGIARLIDAGELDDGQPFMVMEYVDGRPILHYARDLPLDAVLRLFLQVCDAVAFAHRHLIVHADLKPENILVRGDGCVALLDFGIARRLDGAAGEEPELRLTPQYAAPEQLAGAAPSTQTDVFALGVLLYELISGQAPWGERASHGTLALWQRIRDERPRPPSERVPSGAARRRLRGDLDAIVDRAMQPDLAVRHASVEALVSELKDHLARRPIASRAESRGYRVQRWLSRHWLAAGVGMVMFAGTVLAFVAITSARNAALRERDLAQVEVRRGNAVRDYLAHMFREARQLTPEDEITARQLLVRAADRVQSSFAADPQAQSDVLKALGELNFHLDDYAAAEPLLRRWLEQESRILDPEAAADVRLTLAQTVLHRGQREEAAVLLERAQAHWRGDSVRHAEMLLASRNLEARLHREAGDRAAELQTLERALAERMARSGPNHFETATLLTNLGAAQIQAGRLEAGIATSREALERWHALELDASKDALNTRNNLAAAFFRQGDLSAADQAFTEAIALRRVAHGPSAATAALLGNHARVLQQLGRAEQALARVEEAVAMAAIHAGQGSVLTSRSA